MVEVGRVLSTDSEERIQVYEEYIQASIPFAHKVSVLVVSRDLVKMNTEQEVQELCNIDK